MGQWFSAAKTTARIAAEYDTFWASAWNSSDDWTIAGEGSLRMLALRELPPSIGRILDVGCGNGLAMSRLSRFDGGIIGCDISSRALENARKYGVVVRANGARLPFRSGSFGCILLLDALEHVVEKRLLIRECWRVLAEPGMVVLTTPHPRATGGRGDQRQPYDRPVAFSEIATMTSGLFELNAARGILRLPGLPVVWRGLPPKLFMTFPILLERSLEISLVLRKKDKEREIGGR